MVIGVLCEHLDRFYQEILHILISLLRDKNSQMRYEVLITLGHVINGFGATNREIYHVVQTSLCDRMMLIRSAAALVSFSFQSSTRIRFSLSSVSLR